MASPFFWGIMFFFNALQSIMFGYLEVFSRKKLNLTILLCFLTEVIKL